MKPTVFPSLTRFSLRRETGSLGIVCLAAIFLSPLRTPAQTDWPDVFHDPQALRYSPLKQIDAHNVGRLAPAWTFRLKDEDNANGSRTIESVPLVVNGRMYVSWPFCHVAALDPETGRQLWHYTASNCPYRGPGLSSMRSLSPGQ
jgi:glucose dehydrogenase